MGADSQKYGVKAPAFLFCGHIFDPVIVSEFYPHIGNPLDFRFQDGPRKAVARDAEMHHSSGYGSGLVNLDFVPHAA